MQAKGSIFPLLGFLDKYLQPTPIVRADRRNKSQGGAYTLLGLERDPAAKPLRNLCGDGQS
jgi:hypothetical protein